MQGPPRDGGWVQHARRPTRLLPEWLQLSTNEDGWKSEALASPSTPEPRGWSIPTFRQEAGPCSNASIVSCGHGQLRSHLLFIFPEIRGVEFLRRLSLETGITHKRRPSRTPDGAPWPGSAPVHLSVPGRDVQATPPPAGRRDPRLPRPRNVPTARWSHLFP